MGVIRATIIQAEEGIGGSLVNPGFVVSERLIELRLRAKMMVVEVEQVQSGRFSN
jgi:hypothetical protein